MSDESPSSPRSKGRSPSYPGLALDKAIERARTLYAKEKMYPTPLMTVMKHWGYTNATGRSGIALSALKKFGLLDEVGKGNGEDRQLQLTRLADDILNNPSAKERREAIQAAALAPEIHQELWEEFHDELPSDANLEFSLRRNKLFTESGASEFVREYKDTMEFAGLIGSGASTSDELDRESPEEEPDTETPGDDEAKRTGVPLENLFDQFFSKPARTDGPGERTTPAPPSIQSYPIPIARQGRPPVMISGAFPLSESEWLQFTTVLEAMKPVLTQGDSEV